MIDSLPPIADVVRRFDLAARRSLGQNFLFDLNLTAKIARGAGPLKGMVAVEIGPGPGGLTRALLAEGADHVIAIERDARFVPALNEISAHYPGRVTVIEGDALLVDLVPLLAGRPAHIVANLPYNVGTPLLVRWLESEPWPPWFARLTLMFQREVAERIVATTDRPDDYGRLSVLANWRCTSEILFDVPARAFNPPPKVISSVVRLEPRATPLPCDAAKLSRVTREAFGHRRKMLRQSLKSIFEDPTASLQALGIDPTLRAETIPVAGFVAIANAIRSGA